MSWHYAARKFTCPTEGVQYDLVEVFPDVGPDAHTENAVTIQASSPDMLAKYLRIAAADVEKHPVIEETDDE